MSSELDFDVEELAMLRQLFRSEANDALDTVTRLCLDAGLSKPSPDAFAEMLRVTHAIKGAGGTVGLHSVVEAAHRLEAGLLYQRQLPASWNAVLRDNVVDICDVIRDYVDRAGGTGDGVGAGAGKLEESLLAKLATLTDTHAPTVIVEQDSLPVSLPEPARTHLRIAPERIDTVMSNAGELLFDRTRIERRTQLLRTIAKDISRLRQELRQSLESLPVAPAADASVWQIEHALATQATLLSQTSAALIDETDGLRRTIAELQKSLTAVRMDTAQSLFSYSARALRALRRSTGVEVELVTRGEATEFDKTVAEALHDPIVQLLRNVVSHGVDSSASRAALGKPNHVTITMSAMQEAGFLVLTIADDGSGVDTKTLRARLVQNKLWTDVRASTATDAEVLQSLFITPVSVKGDATTMSGHGIGLDSVRQNIARLGGEVSVSSSSGRGTTFTLRLPLSTAVGSAMIFKVGGQAYALPSVFVPQSMTVASGDTHMMVVHESVPILSLEVLLGQPKPTGNRSALLITYAGRSVLCTVDKVVGTREIVIKQLDPILASLTLYTGATISGSGKVQLILDPAQLVRRGWTSSGLPSTKQAATGAGQRAKRALVVDDSRAIREAMTSMLSREGWIVDVAEDGARAITQCKTTEYSLVVTDLEMPNVDGWELISAIRQDPSRSELDVIIITSRANAENRRRAKELGVGALVAKPITRRKLLDAIAIFAESQTDQTT
jgi:chemotaxis protein histidine kinase CheA/ActR/RegA family two-component response regulator